MTSGETQAPACKSAPVNGTALSVTVTGIVQGVGFRPFVYQLAGRLGLKGTVANTATGVHIHAEGRPRELEDFVCRLRTQAPPLSQITGINKIHAVYNGFTDFSIRQSTSEHKRTALISPDVAVCSDCLAELYDPDDRRFAYPFINCTNCGPRYTIVEDIPYDRPETSMKNFEMCPDCLAEYKNPESRRFHAQANACPVCGPGAWLIDSKGTRVLCKDPIEKTARLLKQGFIVAVKGLGGFHLAADAQSSAAVELLRQRKNRPAKPFAIMAADAAAVDVFAVMDEKEKALLESPGCPIVLLEKRSGGLIAQNVSPDNSHFGVMIAYTPLHSLLFSHGFGALVMTSGNLSGEPLVSENHEAAERLSGIADFFLVHDRGIHVRCDDSIVRRAEGGPFVLRRSRGYAPSPVFLDCQVPEILACGAELKNTVCLTKGSHAFVSQHIGDLKSPGTLDFFEKTISHIKRITDTEPGFIACDMHPGYFATRYAHKQKHLPCIPVQHHHAHVVSCMAEHHLQGSVIGLAFDGTGYGTDETVWGGEVMVAERAGFKRAAHLSYAAMPGGDAAVKEPWRMGLSYLTEAFGADWQNTGLRFLREISPEYLRVAAEMINRRINSPLTSSMGRLFDGVAAISGLCSRVDFEAQAAIKLEMQAAGGVLPLDKTRCYGYEFDETDTGIIRIPAAPMIRGIVDDLLKGASPGIVSKKFHTTIIFLFSDVCDRISGATGLKRVVLSGGVFQNAVLLEGMCESLKERGFSVFVNRRVPANDGGISLGQAVCAAEMIGKGSFPGPDSKG
ncbi:MAG: carbamoyltransferase HypF [Thermodesulfobacteriota bacterium]